MGRDPDAGQRDQSVSVANSPLRREVRGARLNRKDLQPPHASVFFFLIRFGNAASHYATARGWRAQFRPRLARKSQQPSQTKIMSRLAQKVFTSLITK
jgi:hypothetical protein